MKTIYSRLFTTAILFLILNSCNKLPPVDCPWTSKPITFFFQIKTNAKLLADSILVNTKLSYLEGGDKKYLTYFGKLGVPYEKNGILFAQTLQKLIISNNIKQFFLEYPNGLASDTLFIDCLLPTLNTNCTLQFTKVVFNKTVNIQVDTSFNLPEPVYVFNKN